MCVCVCKGKEYNFPSLHPFFFLSPSTSPYCFRHFLSLHPIRRFPPLENLSNISRERERESWFASAVLTPVHNMVILHDFYSRSLQKPPQKFLWCLAYYLRDTVLPFSFRKLTQKTLGGVKKESIV